MALLGALAKFGMGMLHGDGNTRQCMATSVVAYKQAFGFDAPPYTYADFEESDVIVLVGSNLVHRPSDPLAARDAQSASAGDHRHRSAGDRNGDGRHAASGRSIRSRTSTLLYGVAGMLIERGWIDRDFIDCPHERLRRVRRVRRRLHARSRRRGDAACRPRRSSSSPRTIHDGKRVSFWWTMGVNQSHQAVRTAQAIINLALMTGNIGRPGTGANSITGQCNAMGSRLFSNTTNLLGGHDFANAGASPQGRRRARHRRGDDSARSELAVPPHPGRHSARRNPRPVGHRHESRPLVDQPGHGPRRARAARLPRGAGHVPHDRDGAAGRPGAARGGWGEKDGTFINSERRIGVVRKGAPCAGRGARRFPHLQARRRLLGLRRNVSPVGVARGRVPVAQAALAPASRATSPASKTTRCSTNAAASNGRSQTADCRLRNADWTTQIRNPISEIRTERRLFEDGRFYHPDGRARFLCESPRPLPEQPNAKYPFVLLTGRGSAAQWHTQTRTAKSAILRKLYAQELYVEINPHDRSGSAFAPAIA